MKILLDTNILLDVAFQSIPSSQKVFDWCETGNPESTIVAFHALTDVYYQLHNYWRKHLVKTKIHAKGLDPDSADKKVRRQVDKITKQSSVEAQHDAKDFLENLLTWVDLAPVSESLSVEGLQRPGDFEDNMQCIFARENLADFVVTRDKTFRCSDVEVISPDEFVTRVISPQVKAIRISKLVDRALQTNVIEQRGGWYIFKSENFGQGRTKVVDKLSQDEALAIRVQTAVDDTLRIL